jgi:hypothetical protein
MVCDWAPEKPYPVINSAATMLQAYTLPMQSMTTKAANTVKYLFII